MTTLTSQTLLPSTLAPDIVRSCQRRLADLMLWSVALLALLYMDDASCEPRPHTGNLK